MSLIFISFFQHSFQKGFMWIYWLEKTLFWSPISIYLHWKITINIKATMVAAASKNFNIRSLCFFSSLLNVIVSYFFATVFCHRFMPHGEFLKEQTREFCSCFFSLLFQFCSWLYQIAFCPSFVVFPVSSAVVPFCDHPFPQRETSQRHIFQEV